MTVEILSMEQLAVSSLRHITKASPTSFVKDMADERHMNIHRRKMCGYYTSRSERDSISGLWEFGVFIGVVQV